MLIPHAEILKTLKTHNINITGALHIGAHDCEELGFYKNSLQILDSDIIWIDAIKEKVEECKLKGIKNIYNDVISDKDNETVIFNISNNHQSSSILELGTHTVHHPGIFYKLKRVMKSTTIDSFMKKNSFNSKKYNFWNFDIQGAELLALKGGLESIKSVDAIYLEVNTEEIYKTCPLISEIDDFLYKFGFTRVITNITQWKWGDALYIKSNITSNHH